MNFSKNLKKFKNIKHCFFSRKGGFSSGIYKSLNCGRGSNDKKRNINKNLGRVSKKMNVKKNLKNRSENMFFEGYLSLSVAMRPRRPSVGTIGRATARSSRSVRSVRYSDRRETSGKRVSDDLQLSIFSRRKIFFGKVFAIFLRFFVILSRFWADF